MLDYSRSGDSKSAKDSFYAALSTARSELDKIEQAYVENWEPKEEYRKSRSAILEDMVALLKKNNIKLEKPLSRCNNEEAVHALLEIAPTLPYEEREEVKVAVVRIDERYKQIEYYGKKLDELANQLANFYVPEKDYDDEVIISLKDYQMDKENTETFEESSSKETIDETVSIEGADDFKEDSSDFFSYFEDHLAEEQEEALPEINDTEMDEPENGVVYTLKDKQTLEEVVEYVYEGQVSWYDIYLYGNNKETLDQFCEEYGYDIEDAVRTKGILTGLSFEFPQQIKTTKVENENPRKMAA